MTLTVSSIENSTAPQPKSDDASHFPAARASRRTGFSSSGSSEPRSRSPAVESMASCMPPVSAAMTSSSGRMLSCVASRCCELDTSTSSIRTALATDGATPRAISRRPPVWLE